MQDNASDYLWFEEITTSNVRLMMNAFNKGELSFEGAQYLTRGSFGSIQSKGNYVIKTISMDEEGVYLPNLTRNSMKSSHSLKSTQPINSSESTNSSETINSPESVRSSRSMNSPESVRSSRSMNSPESVKSSGSMEEYDRMQDKGNYRAREFVEHENMMRQISDGDQLDLTKYYYPIPILIGHGVMPEEGFYYAVMERIRGMPLTDFIIDRVNDLSPVPLETILKKMYLNLNHLRDKTNFTSHGDLHPNNVMLILNPSPGRYPRDSLAYIEGATVSIIDFGRSSFGDIYSHYASIDYGVFSVVCGSIMAMLRAWGISKFVVRKDSPAIPYMTAPILYQMIRLLALRTSKESRKLTEMLTEIVPESYVQKFISFVKKYKTLAYLCRVALRILFGMFEQDTKEPYNVSIYNDSVLVNSMTNLQNYFDAVNRETINEGMMAYVEYSKEASQSMFPKTLIPFINPESMLSYLQS
jgi:hypothetical protein